MTALNFPSNPVLNAVHTAGGKAWKFNGVSWVSNALPVVTSFNSRADAVTLNSGDVTGALGFTPYNSTNPSGYTANTGTVTSVSGTGTVSGLTLTGTVTSSGNLTLGGALSLQASDIPALDASKITSGTIDAARLPSYVDDVAESANLAAFPATGESGKIYVALDTNKTYRWSGSAYVYITSGAVDSVAGKTGVVTLVKADVGLSSVDNTSDAAKPISTATQNALDAKQSSLVSGTNIKTVNGTSLLGSGNIQIAGGSSDLTAVTTSIIPATTGNTVKTLGNNDHRWKGLSLENYSDLTGSVYPVGTITSINSSTITVPTILDTALMQTFDISNAIHGGGWVTSEDLTGGTGGGISTPGLDTGYSALIRDNSAIVLPDDPALTFGTSNFTIEFWYHPLADNQYWAMIMDAGSNNKTAIGVGANNGATTGHISFMVGDGAALLQTGNSIADSSRWYHIACVRNGSTASIYVDGTLDVSNNVYGSISGDLRNGRFGHSAYGGGGGGDNYTNAHYTNVRISNIARYSANFIPSKTALTSDSNTLLLLNFTDTSNLLLDTRPSNRTLTYAVAAPIASTMSPNYPGTYIPDPSSAVLTAYGFWSSHIYRVTLYFYGTFLPTDGGGNNALYNLLATIPANTNISLLGIALNTTNNNLQVTPSNGAYWQQYLTIEGTGQDVESWLQLNPGTWLTSSIPIVSNIRTVELNVPAQVISNTQAVAINGKVATPTQVNFQNILVGYDYNTGISIEYAGPNSGTWDWVRDTVENTSSSWTKDTYIGKPITIRISNIVNPNTGQIVTTGESTPLSSVLALDYIESFKVGSLISISADTSAFTGSTYTNPSPTAILGLKVSSVPYVNMWSQLCIDCIVESEGTPNEIDILGRYFTTSLAYNITVPSSNTLLTTYTLSLDKIVPNSLFSEISSSGQGYVVPSTGTLPFVVGDAVGIAVDPVMYYSVPGSNSPAIFSKLNIRTNSISTPWSTTPPIILDNTHNNIKSSNAGALTINTDNCIVLGNLASSSSSNTVSIGYNTGAHHYAAISIGSNSTVSSYGGIAIGTNAVANGNTASISIGRGTTSNECGVSIGCYSAATEPYATAIGYTSTALESGIALGLNATADRGMFAYSISKASNAYRNKNFVVSRHTNASIPISTPSTYYIGLGNHTSVLTDTNYTPNDYAVNIHPAVYNSGAILTLTVRSILTASPVTYPNDWIILDQTYIVRRTNNGSNNRTVTITQVGSTTVFTSGGGTNATLANWTPSLQLVTPSVSYTNLVCKIVKTGTIPMQVHMTVTGTTLQYDKTF